MGYYMAGGSVNPFAYPVGEDIERQLKAQAMTGGRGAISGAGMLAGPGGGWLTDDPNYELDRPASPRMNMANPRAARRAMRRITAFAKAAQKIVRFPKAKHHHKAAPFRRRRKRK